ncbi:uncharacterized protein YbjT (DUF2867 family) [Streptomyces sp. 3211.6]|uniref:NmrA family NAD(P)-binding protein n=1 Tax=Streptomyces sp. 3211.6 TaxID=1938845 RepID=UPI000EB4F733|nr:NmrA family NAD(P)-binding protein [Streptomyces sp. 3211.6]RKT05548.1 uncharacterized protein YbjT (DUF2867 family) [Streptomyces sp. 3211.6]
MIVVMGATGATGSALLHRLTELGIPTRALSRNPGRLRTRLDSTTLSQTEVLAADAAAPASLRAAFTGATQLFLTMANSPAQVALETDVIAAAAESGIGHIVKLSAPGAGPDSPVAIARGHHTIEVALRSSGPTCTVLRPYAFMQKLLLLAPGVAAGGVIHGAMADAACNYIDCRDIADVAAAALTRPEIAGHTYTLTGDRTYSHPQLADLLGSLLERDVQYVDLPGTDLHRHLTGTARMPGWLASHIVEIQHMATTHPEEPNDTVTRILGRPPRALETFLHEHLDLFRGGPWTEPELPFGLPEVHN